MTALAVASASAPRILVLGGSAEGFAVAAALAARGYHVTSSFAGRTQQRREPAGFTRVGGFGGPDGLAAYLAVDHVALVIDATHPFASHMKRNASIACAESGTPLIHLERAPWTPEPGDDWRSAPDMASAAALAPVTDGACFLTIGRQEIHHFERRHDLSFVIRVIDPPEHPFRHPRALFIHDRGPYAVEAERALFDANHVTCVVTKNSGAEAAAAKLVVARERGLPVIVVERPPRPEGSVVPTVEAAVAAADEMLGPVEA